MPKNGEIQNVAIVGTGVIGASWAAEFLAHGFDVVATDPAPNAEPNLRKYIDAAWPALTAKGLAKRVERQTDIYSRSQKGGVACGLCSGERSGTAGSSAISKRPNRRCVAPVKAPFSWPNNSEETSVGGSAAQFTVTKGRPDRCDRL